MDTSVRLWPYDNQAETPIDHICLIMLSCICSCLLFTYAYSVFSRSCIFVIMVTIPSYGACRLPCTRVNCKVLHVARVSRTRENRMKRNYTSFYFRADSVARAMRLPNQSAVNRPHLIYYERETGGVNKFT